MEDFLKGLDKFQKEAVLCTEGPVLIIAGAGSGKTRVLTSRIAHLLSEGKSPERILALTFTKKAANEMRERIASMVGYRVAGKLYMGTFHAIFIRIMRIYASCIGYPESFTIYDESDSKSALKQCMKELGIDYNLKAVKYRISSAKNNLVTHDKYSSNPKIIENDRRAKMPDIHKIYSLYQEKMRIAGVMDFDDILLNMNIIMYKYPVESFKIASMFDYIMLDEYQDTNTAQYFIIKKMAEYHKNVCVVGDDSQSIYSFRGAKIENILSFSSDYPNAKTFKLEQNYRSTKVIVEAANSLINNNINRIKKSCFSNAESGDKINLIKSDTDRIEASKVVTSILSDLRESGRNYGDYAILYRTNAQSRLFEDFLMNAKIPYRIYSGMAFFDRQEVKDSMAYMKLIVNPNEDESFRRVINKPARAIGKTTMEALERFASSKSLSLMQAISDSDIENSSIKKNTIKNLREFALMIMKLHTEHRNKDAFDIAASVLEKSGLYAMYRMEKSEEDLERVANIDELLNSIKNFVEDSKKNHINYLLEQKSYDSSEDVPDNEIPVYNLAEYLETIALQSNVDVEDNSDKNVVTLMTVHASKGLEFPVIYVVGMEESLFPSFMDGSGNEDEIEEERRLFYVAMTRAEKKLVLSYSGTRMKRGSLNKTYPSRFLYEIDRQYYDKYSASVLSNNRANDSYVERSSLSSDIRFAVRNNPETTIFKRKSNVPVKEDKDFIPSPVSDIHTGLEIEHNRFGKGRVLSVSGEGDNIVAEIRFEEFGEKKLLLKYAKIRVI